MDVRAFGKNPDVFKLLCLSVEAEDALVVDAYPHVSVAVGHHASRITELAVHLVLSRPLSRHFQVVPQRQTVFFGNPQSVGLCVVCHRIYRVFSVKNAKVGLLRADEVNAGAVVSNPNVAVRVLQDASRVKR